MSQRGTFCIYCELLCLTVETSLQVPQDCPKTNDPFTFSQIPGQFENFRLSLSLQKEVRLESSLQVLALQYLTLTDQQLEVFGPKASAAVR